ncbi:hypothetical protein LPB303_09070 [Polaribacter atrinae]|uniref:Uncharacterized protein n=1 Tax=Polaribacter atrinae TaxID=1333662 RepID=A0A176TAY8_9FLAO|nr:hypothetical protein LPB303_09070 [Polaribacter atrinae]
MYNFLKLHIIYLLLLVITNIYAQEISVINNKGTILNVRNNNVTNSNAPPINPVENDIWFDTSSLSTIIKIYDGTTWEKLSSSGIEGSLFYASSIGVPTENNSQLFWDTTNNRFGIGTNNPSHKLHVTGAIRSEGVLNSKGTVGEPSYRFRDDIDTGMYSPVADEIRFSVGGIEALNIDEIANTTTVTIKETLKLDGLVLDENNSAGITGQILSTTATGTNWIDASTINSDNQKIDVYALNADGKNLDISLENDAETKLQTDLSALKIAGDVSGTLAASTVERIQNINISNINPTNGQTLVYDNSASKYIPKTIFTPTVSERYPNTTQTIAELATFTTINFQSQDFAPTATDYTNTSDGIIVLKSGRYKITYRITSEIINGTRVGGEFQLTKNTTPVNNTKAYSHQTSTLVNKSTVTMMKILDLATNDKIGVQGRVYESENLTPDSLTIIPEGSMLTIEKIN